MNLLGRWKLNPVEINRIDKSPSRQVVSAAFGGSWLQVLAIQAADEQEKHAIVAPSTGFVWDQGNQGNRFCWMTGICWDHLAYWNYLILPFSLYPPCSKPFGGWSPWLPKAAWMNMAVYYGFVSGASWQEKLFSVVRISQWFELDSFTRQRIKQDLGWVEHCWNMFAATLTLLRVWLQVAMKIKLMLFPQSTYCS